MGCRHTCSQCDAERRLARKRAASAPTSGPSTGSPAALARVPPIPHLQLRQLAAERGLCLVQPALVGGQGGQLLRQARRLLLCSLKVSCSGRTIERAARLGVPTTSAGSLQALASPSPTRRPPPAPHPPVRAAILSCAAASWLLAPSSSPRRASSDCPASASSLSRPAARSSACCAWAVAASREV